MAFQMVYTSVRSGLVAGRSGFCTAARHKDLKESLVARLEDFSAQYDRGLAGGTAESQLPVIYQYRIITIREDRYYVLMRLGDAGNDYTGRTNHIAHSLVLSPTEVAGLRLNPAEVILGLTQRGFWRTRYEEPARYFGNEDIIDLTTLPPAASLPAVHWSRRTGSPVNAAQLFDSNRPTEAGVVLSGSGEGEGFELLRLFAESLLLLGPDRSNHQDLWSVPFTSILQSSSEKSHFRWCGILQSGTLLPQEARSGRKILNLGSPLLPPSGPLAEIAQGLTPSLIAGTSEPEESPSYRSIPFPAESGQPPVATIISGTSGSQAPPSAEVKSESFVSISLEDPKRARRAEKKRNGRGLVLAFGTAMLVIIIIAAWLRFKDKGVREREAEVRSLVAAEKWEDIRRLYTGKRITEDQKKRSPELANWDAAAKAIVRFNKIKSRPHEFCKTVPGEDTVEDAIATIKDEWVEGHKDSEADLQKKVSNAEDGAKNSAKAWKSSVESMTDAWDAAGKRFEQWEIASGEELKKQISITLKNLDDLELNALHSATHLKKLFEILRDEITPAIEKLKGFKNEYGEETALAEAKKQAENQASELTTHLSEVEKLCKLLNESQGTEKLREEAQKTCKDLYAKFEGLSSPGVLKQKQVLNKSVVPEPPRPNLPSDQTRVSSAQEKASIPRTYIVLKSPDGDIDLRGVEEFRAKFPESFSILQISTLRGEEPEQAEQSSSKNVEKKGHEENIYSKGTLVFSGAKIRILKIENGDDKFWEGFPGGFVLQFPEMQASAPEFRIAVIEVSASANESTTTQVGEHVFELPLSKFLKRLDNGEVALSNDARAIAESLDFPEGAKPSFELVLSGVNPSSSTATSAVELRVSPLPALEKEILRIEGNIKQINSNVSTAANFERDYGRLGQKLFPEFFLEDGIRALAISPPPIGSKDKDFGIVKLGPKTDRPRSSFRNPIIGTFQEFRVSQKPRFSEKPLFQDFHEYVESLFKSLDELADGSSGLNKANNRIQRFIENSKDLNETNGVDPFLYGWIQIEKVSRSENWSTPKGVDPTPKKFPSELDAKDSLKEYVAEKYFSDFFEAWEGLFTPEKARALFDYLSKNNGQQLVVDPKTEQSRLDQLNALKSRFTNTDLIDDGIYSLNLVYLVKGPNSPPPIRQVIPLIKSAPAAN
jgi:hypothetical protein